MVSETSRQVDLAEATGAGVYRIFRRLSASVESVAEQITNPLGFDVCQSDEMLSECYTVYNVRNAYLQYNPDRVCSPPHALDVFLAASRPQAKRTYGSGRSG